MLEHEQRIKDLEALLLTANETTAQLTKANADLTVGLEYSERMLKKLKRHSRSDASGLRDQIAVLQSRRG